MSSPQPPERRQLSVMLCDLVGWSSLAQRLDAEELAEVVQAYRRRCADLVVRHGGIVAQYVGDGLLAYFGYPRAHEDDAERAIRAALALAASEPAGPGSQVHIGIATGVVVVGNVVDAAAQPAPLGVDAGISAVGGALNLAARLQALAGPRMVVVSDTTRRLAGGIFEYRDLGRHELKGFDGPVQAWQVLGASTVRSRFQALRAATLTPLVDRERELQELRRLWEQARAGRGNAVLLASEPGVGKSRLVAEVAAQIVEPDCLRLRYYCAPHLQSSPLAPLINHLVRAANIADADDDGTKLGKLARLFREAADDAETVPLFAQLLSIRYEGRYPALNMSPQRHKQRLFEVLLRGLELNAAQRPVLIVVEDLHWIDPSTDELVGLIVDSVQRLPILMLLTARPEFRFGRPGLIRMNLAALERRDSIRMIELICGDRALPPAAIGQIADQTDGLPLFIEDLTRDLIEMSATQQASGAAAPRAAFAIPATLTDALMARLDRLDSAKAVAQIGAVIGREFSHELLAQVAELPADELREALYRLVDSGLLLSRRSGAGPSYAFKHALVRDAAYASLLKKAQVAWHACVARVLLESFPDTAEAHPEVLAYHFEAARDVERAVESLVKAAKLSAKRSGFVEAIAQLESALRLLATQPPSRARLQQELRVHLTLGGVNAEYRGFSSEECARAYDAALQLCRELGDAPEIFSVLSGVGSVEITRAHFDRCKALAGECLARAAQQSSHPPFVMGHLLLGGTLFLTGALAAAREHLDEALTLYERHAAPQNKQVLYVQDQKSTGLCYLALTLTLLGRPGDGLRAAEQGLAHSRSLGGLHTVNFSLCYLAAVCHIQRRVHPALQYATESLQFAREQGFATWIGVSQMVRGASRVRNGERDAGLAEIVAGIDAHRAMEAIAYQPFGLALYAEGLADCGRFDDALAALERGFALIERTGERFYLAEMRRQQGEILARTGDMAGAANALRNALEIARQQQAGLFEVRSTASLCRLPEPRPLAIDPPAGREAFVSTLRALQEDADAADLADAQVVVAALMQRTAQA
jgi:class 3 adenylate cyclase/tetratricopeptide (TPR) repeat protein